MMRRLQWALLGGVVMAAGCQECGPTGPKPEAEKKKDILGSVLVTIGDTEKVWMGDLIHAVTSYPGPERRLFSGIAAQESLVNRFIDARLVVQESRRLGLDKLPSARHQIESAREQKIAGMQLEAINADLRASAGAVTEQEAYDYYLSNTAQFKKGEQRRLSIIVVRHNPDMAVDERLANEKTIKEAMARLKLGEEFDKVAARYSDDVSSTRGGDIGYIGRNFPDEAVRNAAFSLKYVGDVSDIIQDDRFRRIIQLTDIQEDSAVPFEDIAEKIKADMGKRLQRDGLDDRISKVVFAERKAVYPDRLNFNADGCEGDKTALAEFYRANPLTVEEYCDALQDRAGFRPDAIDRLDFRSKLLEDLVQQRSLAATAEPEVGESADVFFETRRREERVLYQEFNRHFSEHLYVWKATQGDLKQFYENNPAKFLDPTTGQPLPFETAFEEIRKQYDLDQRQKQFRAYVDNLRAQFPVVYDKRRLEAEQEKLRGLIDQVDNASQPTPAQTAGE